MHSPGGSQTRPLEISSRYRILRKLGAGSVGTVYLAHDSDDDRQVALKVIPAERFDYGALERLQEEFRTIASLSHPQILSAYDFGYSDRGGVPFFAREFVSGEPLKAGPPDTRARQNPGLHLRPIIDLLDALEYLHAHEILHLDIHAGNVIVSDSVERGTVLIDFGLVRPDLPVLSSLSVPADGPPELLAGETPDARTDLYAVGRLLLYRLTGSRQGTAILPREIPGWSTG